MKAIGIILLLLIMTMNISATIIAVPKNRIRYKQESMFQSMEIQFLSVPENILRTLILTVKTLLWLRT